ncbi:nuclear transport factor 2 family protein [Croceicoccus bisphenolivorans]|uniref:nuclear transport factor 2 family protein n=1 Tax=Croceicoccus bisphenolivorans TaxID=1783232 RepID=UPI00082DF2B7|nr:nuclear transport factor 2 family protein [Croceicoccus bisphenolivorans]
MTVEIQQFIADYWADVDENRGQGAPEFYTEDCVLYVGSDRTFEGRAGIVDFYRYRADRGERTTRHATSNYQVVPLSDTSAKVTFVVANYASDGPPPITGSKGPSLVSRVDCELHCKEPGLWQIKSLRGTPLFIGDEPYTVAVLVEGRHDAKVGD